MDKHGKVSLRKKQLTKVGIIPQYFDKTLLGSTFVNEFEYSLQNNGHTTLLPVDWQIDLGNYCNSACIFCTAYDSSKLAKELYDLGFIKETPVKSWTSDPILVDKFIQVLESTPALEYLHFIGGEPLINPAFKRILDRLHKIGKTEPIVGFTTNLTVYDDALISKLAKFKNVHVGISIETLHSVNDYLRYPVDTKQAICQLDQWIQTAYEYNWSLQIRTTPTLFSINYLDELYEYAYQNNVTIEACNFIEDPAFMRPSVLPKSYRLEAAQKLQKWINKHNDNAKDDVLNVRDPNQVRSYLLQDAQSYVHYLKNETDETHRLPDLINYIKGLESVRNNCILDYLPEYENFLRSAGY
jgi:sulfatase maturation enzyme AslB (radical SAM superfamily)